jgi:streptomycin 6-kinase
LLRYSFAKMESDGSAELWRRLKAGAFAAPAIIEQRVERFARELGFDTTRLLSWAFAQAVLSAIWAAGDGVAIQLGHAGIALANAIQPMLPGSADA